ncbi:trigger factor [Huintestinicola sp.]|uniref:trigger factor n=1 Tax=Huintestinicola sp. TaxID=2981661 RepID=UPI003D7C8804|nr:trigger factor [Oscillospiraceae bacterium]
MSLKSTNKIETNIYELEVEASAEEFESAVQAAYQKAKNKINVPGFRKGKAPRKMIEKLYGESCFYDDAVNAMVPFVVGKAIDEAGIEVVDRPEIDVTALSKDTGVAFKVKCIAKPEVEISDYKGIEVEKTVKTITDEDVDNQLKSMQERNGRLITIEDRAVENGDTVVIDFEGFMDGKAFDGGKENGFSLKIGSGQFIPGFEEQIVGKSTGEDFTINVTFPENYQMEELAGKPAEFKIKLHEIKATELPDLDDDFAKDTSEFDTLDELKADLKKKLEENASKNADAAAENAVYDKVIEKMNAEIPQVMFEHKIDDMVRDFEMRLSQQGLDLPMYLSFTGMDEAAFRDTFKDQAEKTVKLRLALEQIAKLENIEVTDEQVMEELKKMSETYKLPLNQLMSVVSPATLKTDMLVTEASKLVKDSAVIK